MADSVVTQQLVYIKRNPSMTRAQFYDHWKTIHGPLCTKWLQSYGIHGYTQIHQSGKIVPIDSDGKVHELNEYDGIAVFRFTSMDRYLEAFQSDYYFNTVEPDEQRFLDRKGLMGGILARVQGPENKVH